MGVPRLRQHLLPFSQSVLLHGGTKIDDEDTEYIKNVVVDGPALVYNVYSRLLSWFSATDCSMIEVLPTCDEVSQGVMLYLLHLELLGVEIFGIYFDGALPARKYETRVARLESQRQRLEFFCAETKSGFEASSTLYAQRTVRPDNVLRSRPISTRYHNLPVDPFMVAAVFEDLKYRWNWLNIKNISADSLGGYLSHSEVFPWASLTHMVTGEADTSCANAARLRNASILTNDSDLVLHDLGHHGAVIILDSVELIRSNFIHPSPSFVKAAMLRPSLVAQRLNLPGLLPLGFQLKTYPKNSLMELLQQSKHVLALAEHAAYQDFAIEYQGDHAGIQRQALNQTRGFLDTRVSELVWQYELPTEYTIKGIPHVYLPILIEDHTRRCAWDNGRDYRSMAYSLLNISRPRNERHEYVSEFIRRGQRIVKDKLQLQDESGISARIKTFEAQLDALRATIGIQNSPRDFWMLFAVRVVYGTDFQFTKGDIQSLEQFLRLGHMGKRLQWLDLHLTAQIHAVLYSLRMLKQLIDLLNPEYAVVLGLKASLGGLPPLHAMMNTRQRGLPRTAAVTTAQLSAILHHPVWARQSRCPEGSCGVLHHKPLEQTDNGDADPPCTSNIYELLQEQ
ncbi:XPG domain containing-domain-containing protein [Aspergillus unguis]